MGFFSSGKGLKTKANNILAGYHPIVSSGLVLYFDPHDPNSFNPSGSSTIYDLSGYDNHGLISNSVNLTNNSLPLANNYIIVPDNSSLVMTNSFTQFIWAKFDYEETGSYKVLFGKPSYYTYGLIVEWIGGNFILADFSSYNGRNALGYYPDVAGWNLIAHTYDNSIGGHNHYLYICHNNQIFVSRVAHVDSVNDAGLDVQIGDPNFSMSIGKAGLYNRALGFDEIKKIYLTTKSIYGSSNELVSTKRIGCTIPGNPVYDSEADTNFGCWFLGCTDPNATNYDPNANINDNSCEYY